MIMVKQLLKNIKAFSHPSPYPITSIWPPHRRSSVLILLFIGHYGELRVLLTKRSRQLNNFSGHVSLPGGKADTVQESEWDVALREANEEIGLPYGEQLRKQGLQLEQLNILPCYLSRTFLSVRPCVALLTNTKDPLGPIEGLKLLLNPGETASIFSIPLLDLVDGNKKQEYIKKSLVQYRWGGIKWPLKHYYYPTKNSNEVGWLDDVLDLSSDDELQFADGMSSESKSTEIKELWGLTAQMLYDLAEIAVHDGEFKNHIGNEDLIYGLTEFGQQMLVRERSDWESGMIRNDRKKNYKQVLPKHVFDKINENFKL